MKLIAENIEKTFPYDIWRNKRHERAERQETVSNAISAASCDIAEHIHARAIVATTTSGYSARQIASHRPPMPIMAASPSTKTQRQLALVWGVDCLLVPEFFQTDEMLDVTVKALQPYRLDAGDKIVITAGVPFGRTTTTNLIQIHNITSDGKMGVVDDDQ
jgi:pyruvate kinase